MGKKSEAKKNNSFVREVHIHSTDKGHATTYVYPHRQAEEDTVASTADLPLAVCGAVAHWGIIIKLLSYR